MLIVDFFFLLLFLSIQLKIMCCTKILNAVHPEECAFTILSLSCEHRKKQVYLLMSFQYRASTESGGASIVQPQD